MTHSIDTFLLTKFFNNNSRTDHAVSVNILQWYAALGSVENETLREKASLFLQTLAKLHLTELHLPHEKQESLVRIFEPLENIFRLALSLSTKGALRDHLSHTIRNYLFSHYILSKINAPYDARLYRLLAIAAVFHDIAYPIEKFKKGTKELSDKLFKEYLDSRGVLDWELTDPNELLNVLDVVGHSEHEGIAYLYKNVVVPSIAGEGLFNAPHCLSSVVLFMRHIIKEWKDSQQYWKSKSDEITTICLAMAHHDRKMYPSYVTSDEKRGGIIRALRLADELQEWGRDRRELSYVDDVVINETGNQDIFLGITYTMKHRTDQKLDIGIFLADKILGICPILETETVTLCCKIPEQTEINSIDQIKDKVDGARFLNLHDTPHAPIQLNIQNISANATSILLTFKKNSVVIEEKND